MVDAVHLYHVVYSCAGFTVVCVVNAIHLYHVVYRCAGFTVVCGVDAVHLRIAPTTLSHHRDGETVHREFDRQTTTGEH